MENLINSKKRCSLNKNEALEDIYKTVEAFFDSQNVSSCTGHITEILLDARRGIYEGDLCVSSDINQKTETVLYLNKFLVELNSHLERYVFLSKRE